MPLFHIHVTAPRLQAHVGIKARHMRCPHLRNLDQSARVAAVGRLGHAEPRTRRRLGLHSLDPRRGRAGRDARHVSQLRAHAARAHPQGGRGHRQALRPLCAVLPLRKLRSAAAARAAHRGSLPRRRRTDVRDDREHAHRRKPTQPPAQDAGGRAVGGAAGPHPERRRQCSGITAGRGRDLRARRVRHQGVRVQDAHEGRPEHRRVPPHEADLKGNSRPWLRTGDKGFFDADGYLQLSGRFKEAINRGGEKSERPPLRMENRLPCVCLPLAAPHHRGGLTNSHRSVLANTEPFALRCCPTAAPWSRHGSLAD
eukprot:7146251-Prymnesium_polylepis.1